MILIDSLTLKDINRAFSMIQQHLPSSTGSSTSTIDSSDISQFRSGQASLKTLVDQIVADLATSNGNITALQLFVTTLVPKITTVNTLPLTTDITIDDTLIPHNAQQSVHDKLMSLSNLFNILGNVNYYSDLPSPTLPTLNAGDTYVVLEDATHSNMQTLYVLDDTGGTRHWQFLAYFGANLNNYYTKSETYNQSQTNILLSASEQSAITSATAQANSYTDTALAQYVPKTRKINGYTLNVDVQLTALSIPYRQGTVQSALDSLTGMFTLRGSVSTILDLPQYPNPGDGYVVLDVGGLYVAGTNPTTGNIEWTYCGNFLPNLANYYTKSETYSQAEVDQSQAQQTTDLEVEITNGDFITLRDSRQYTDNQLTYFLTQANSYSDGLLTLSRSIFVPRIATIDGISLGADSIILPGTSIPISATDQRSVTDVLLALESAGALSIVAETRLLLNTNYPATNNRNELAIIKRDETQGNVTTINLSENTSGSTWQWTLIGAFTVDLTNYYTKTEANTRFDITFSSAGYGTRYINQNGTPKLPPVLVDDSTNPPIKDKASTANSAIGLVDIAYKNTTIAANQGLLTTKTYADGFKITVTNPSSGVWSLSQTPLSGGSQQILNIPDQTYVNNIYTSLQNTLRVTAQLNSGLYTLLQGAVSLATGILTKNAFMSTLDTNGFRNLVVAGTTLFSDVLTSSGIGKTTQTTGTITLNIGGLEFPRILVQDAVSYNNFVIKLGSLNIDLKQVFAGGTATQVWMNLGGGNFGWNDAFARYIPSGSATSNNVVPIYYVP